MDAFEDVFKQPGVVFLFGKVKPTNVNTYVSCCVVVKNIERRMFLLPKNSVRSKLKLCNINIHSKNWFILQYLLQTSDSQEVKIVDVYNEFNNLTDKYQIQNFKSRKVTKKYAFDLADVADESEYLEIRYSVSKSY